MNLNVVYVFPCGTCGYNNAHGSVPGFSAQADGWTCGPQGISPPSPCPLPEGITGGKASFAKASDAKAAGAI